MVVVYFSSCHPICTSRFVVEYNIPKIDAKMMIVKISGMVNKTRMCAVWNRSNTESKKTMLCVMALNAGGVMIIVFLVTYRSQTMHTCSPSPSIMVRS